MLNQAVSALLLIVFLSSLMGCLCFSLLLRRRNNFTIPLALTCVFEIIGYAIRLSSVTGSWSAPSFVVVTILVTIAPSFVSMAMYTTIERTLEILGKEHSLIHPGWYVYLIWFDLTGLALQLVGLGLALSEISSTASLGPNADPGGGVAGIGIGLHGGTLVVFMVLFAIVLCQAFSTYRRHGSAAMELGSVDSGRVLTRRFKGYLIVITLAVVCLLVRDLYWSIGLMQSFTKANVGEPMFALLDGFVVAEAVLGLVVFHPAWTLVDGYKPKPKQQGKELIGLGFHSNNFI
ncbi:RTA1 domain protein [Apiospora saccharicola]|uniref:RTA1 domain protein n=1 Tax=Apiospora saccharicola TaxID=335842 RepID=A0ABR1WL68_9PEZI